MLLLKRKTFEVESRTPLVKGDDAAVVAKAEDIIAAAETEAAKIAEDAKAAYESEKKRGYDDGIAEGREEILLQKLDLLDESVAFMESVEGKMADIVLKALKKCVSEIGDKELVCQIVKKAMQAIVRNQRQITIKVSPDMVPVVKERLQALLSEFPSVAFAEIAEDPHLAGTACVVETDAGSVEASIDGQLAAIEKSIRKNFAKDSSSNG